MFRKIGLSILLILFNTSIQCVDPVSAARFIFRPQASVSGDYTDNVFLTEEDTESELVTVATAGFQSRLIGKSAGMDLAAYPGYAFYREFDDLSTWRLLANLRGWAQWTRSTRFEIFDDFLRTDDPFENREKFLVRNDRLEDVGDSTVRRFRQPYYTNDARARFTYQFGRQDVLYGEFLYSLLRNEDDPFSEDNDRYQPTVGLDYWFGVNYGFESFISYTRGEYSQPSDFIGDPTSNFNDLLGELRFLNRINRRFSWFGQYDQIYRDFDEDNENDYIIYAPSAGITYAVARQTNLRLGLGYFYQSLENESDREGPFLNGEITQVWQFDKGRIDLLGRSGLNRNEFGAQYLGFERFIALQGQVSYNFTRKFIGEINAYYRYNDVISGAEDAREENRFRGGAGLTYIPFRWMSLALNYTFNKYVSKVEPDYDENRVQFLITLQTSQPWRF